MSTIDEAKKALTTPRMEALIEAMYIAANADEDFGPKEREQFVSNVVGICNGAIKPEEVKGVLLKLKGKAKEGRESRLKSIAGRLPTKADKEHAFALACNMALADGVVLDEEKEFTAELAKALGIEATRADSILDEIRSLEPDEE
ncbi:MAG: tellurite resistance TerB family protein [Deltaproteobacteria bacterium]|nr:tellurite resistance TerB family protein [Deltaproteobacteria bacterium]